MKWVAVGICLIMIWLAVLSDVSVGKAAYIIDKWIESQPNSDRVPYELRWLASGTGAFVAGNAASIAIRLAIGGAVGGPAGAIAALVVGLA